MDRVTIRPALSGDVEDVTELYLKLRDHHVRLQPENIRYGVADEGWRRVGQGAIEEGRVWVAEVAGTIVGFMKLGFVEKPWGISCEIETLVVAEALRGSGIGKALMGTAEQIARDRGARGLRVDVLIGNEDARRLYHGLGYRDTAIRMALDL
jgi:ribosomal protein S18 acetylase RimI-like enzyme